MRIRTIKPEFWANEDIASMSFEARLMAIGLLNLSDDEGYFKFSPPFIKGQIFPYDDSLSAHCLLTECSRIGYIDIYSGTDGKKYGHVRHFIDHQRINRPTESKIKHLCDSIDDSLLNHGVLTEGSQTERKGKEQGKGMEREQGKETRVPRQPIGYNFETWPRSLTDIELKSLKANRKGKQLTQAALDVAYREIQKAMAKGYTFDYCIDEWINRGWVGFKADWIKQDAANGKEDRMIEIRRVADETRAMLGRTS